MVATLVRHSLLVDFELRFHGPSDISIPKSSLPWGNHYSTPLIAVIPYGDTLIQSYPVDDIEPSYVLLRPGAILRGRIDLSEHFPTLKKEVLSREIVVFWTYRLETSRDVRSNRVGGWLSVSP